MLLLSHSTSPLFHATGPRAQGQLLLFTAFLLLFLIISLFLILISSLFPYSSSSQFLIHSSSYSFAPRQMLDQNMWLDWDWYAVIFSSKKIKKLHPFFANNCLKPFDVETSFELKNRDKQLSKMQFKIQKCTNCI